MRRVYKLTRFRPESKILINKVNDLIEQFREGGFDMTLRSMYYRLVAQNIIPNKDTEYDKLGALLNKARLAGLMDWDALEDTTRNLAFRMSWNKPKDIIHTASFWYHVDMWYGQQTRPEVWIEKDAVAGIVNGVCRENDVAYFSCRGYTSQTEMWNAAQRIYKYMDEQDQNVTIFHFGDHDPSGIDMTRDIKERLERFLIIDRYRAIENQREAGGEELDTDEKRDEVYAESADWVSNKFTVERVALTSDQIEEYQPPPNPLKKTDGRWRKYVEKTGYEDSWELDALPPQALKQLIQDSVDPLIDADTWNARLAEEEQGKAELQHLHANFSTAWSALPKLPKPKKKKDD
jgi:hypothetical protein